MIRYDIRLIVMDMDGTLLNTNHEVSPENLCALREARKKGVRIAVCSGRMPADVGAHVLALGLDDCCVLSLNGTCNAERPYETPYANHLIQENVLTEAVSLMLTRKLPFCCILGDSVVSFYLQHQQGQRHWGHAQSELYADGDSSALLDKMLKDGANKMIYVESDLEKLRETRALLEAIPGLDVTTSWAQNLEMMPAGVNKGAAVCELAGRLGLQAEQVMTFGDYDNDESMITYAGMGVAMANATDCVKRAAKHITLSNDEHGVAAAIRRFVLT